MEQIDEILQTKIDDPELEGYNIKLTENPGQGMFIHMMGQVFESIEEDQIQRGVLKVEA